MKLVRLTVLVALMMVTTGLVVLPAPAAEASSSEAVAEGTLFDLHNQARSSPLAWADDVAEVARAWSRQMARERSLYHNPHYPSQTCCWTRVGENVAMRGPVALDGSAADAAQQLMAGWMDSDGHRANILDTRYDHVGIGVTIDADDLMWATAVFRADDGTAPGADNPPPTGAPVDPPTMRDTTAGCPSTVPARGFVDVAGSDLVAAVDCLTAWDVALGVDAQTYDPTGNVTRGQMASFVARAIVNTDGDLPAEAARFPDVPAGYEHADAIGQLAAAGIISGFDDGTFRPGIRVTRAHMSRFLAAGFEHRTGERLAAPSRQWFPDIDGAALEVEINQIADAGWTAGRNDGTYGPSASVTRAQMAHFMTRWISHLVEDGHAPAL